MMDAMQVAREFVIPYFNLRESLFNAAWDYVNVNFEKVSEVLISDSGLTSEKTGIPLSFGGEEQRGAVKAIIIFADGFKEMPLEGDFSSLVDSIKSACGKYHAEEGLTKEILKKVNSLENRIEKFLKPGVIKKVDAGKEAGESEYAVFISAKGGIGAMRDKDTKTEMQFQERYSRRKENYDIFVYEETVYKKLTNKEKVTVIIISLDRNILKLLILFLKYKNIRISYENLYGKAWEGSVNIDDKAVLKMDPTVMNGLKTAVADLRNKFQNIKNFSIPHAKAGGYICEGDFKYCLVLKKTTDQRYTLEGV